MSDTDTATVRQISYRSPTPHAPFELMTITDLVAKIGHDELSKPEQADFDLIVVCTQGVGSHEVDFAEVEIIPHRVLHIRPRQVHRWMLDSTHDGLILIFQQISSLAPAWARPAPFTDLDDDQWNDLQPVLDVVRHQRHSGPASGRALLAMQTLLVDALHIDQDAAEHSSQQDALYAEFRQLLDADGSMSRSVTLYARELGCSNRTLTRACLEASGSTTKQLLDDRILIQAQRLLSIDERTAASVATELGFSEAANFVKFFKRLNGQTPAAWQHANR